MGKPHPIVIVIGENMSTLYKAVLIIATEKSTKPESLFLPQLIKKFG